MTIYIYIYTYIYIQLYCHLLIHAEIYICIYWIHTDAMINDARRKTSLTKYLPLTLLQGFERVVQCLHVRGSWRPNIREYFDPKVMAISVVSFSFSMAAQPEPWSSLSWVLAFPTTLVLSVCNCTACPQLYSPLCLLFNSSALYYLQTHTRWYGHASTPPQLLPISSDRDVSLPVPLEWPVWSSSSGNNRHAVQRSLSSGASVYESIMGFFLPRPISSANFHPRDFLS